MHARTAAVALLGLACLTSVAMSTPPAGRPPINALVRYEPKKYEVVFEVTLMTTAPISNLGDRRPFSVKDAPIVLPVIYLGTYSKVFPGTEDGGVILDSQVASNIVKRTDAGRPFHTHHLVMVIPEFNGVGIRWQMRYTMQSWSAGIDEQRAQQTTWPRDMKWPDEIADGLKPQMFIESDHPYFQNLISTQFGDSLRAMSPYLAAKTIVAYCLNNFQRRHGSSVRSATSTLQGMRVHGALESATRSAIGNRAAGSDHDLVCLCVTMLRAAGIPARPVIGIERKRGESNDFISWAEFYLPDSGWVAFDPTAMKSRGSAQYRNFNAAWPDFGNMKELNERIPLSYHFVPPASGVQSPGYAAVWGWDPRTQQPSYEQFITLRATSRGRGEEDPQ